jgi:hypothetical protein
LILQKPEPVSWTLPAKKMSDMKTDLSQWIYIFSTVLTHTMAGTLAPNSILSSKQDCQMSTASSDTPSKRATPSSRRCAKEMEEAENTANGDVQEAIKKWGFRAQVKVKAMGKLK